MENNIAANYKHINGWGIDADPQNEPTYSMKNYTGDDHNRLDYERDELQPANVEILHSIGRPGLTVVFGTPVPPSGLRGVIRRQAFKYSENLYRHGLPLILADRINIIEGLIDDLAHGHIPNIIKERGWQAGWKQDKKNIITQVAVRVVLVTAVIGLIMNHKKSSKKKLLNF